MTELNIKLIHNYCDTDSQLKFYLINNKQILKVEYIMKNKRVFITLDEQIYRDKICKNVNDIDNFIAETFVELYKRGYIR